MGKDGLNLKKDNLNLKVGQYYRDSDGSLHDWQGKFVSPAVIPADAVVVDVMDVRMSRNEAVGKVKSVVGGELRPSGEKLLVAVTPERVPGHVVMLSEVMGIEFRKLCKALPLLKDVKDRLSEFPVGQVFVYHSKVPSVHSVGGGSYAHLTLDFWTDGRVGRYDFRRLFRPPGLKNDLGVERASRRSVGVKENMANPGILDMLLCLGSEYSNRSISELEGDMVMSDKKRQLKYSFWNLFDIWLSSKANGSGDFDLAHVWSPVCDLSSFLQLLGSPIFCAWFFRRPTVQELAIETMKSSVLENLSRVIDVPVVKGRGSKRVIDYNAVKYNIAIFKLLSGMNMAPNNTSLHKHIHLNMSRNDAMNVEGEINRDLRSTEVSGHQAITMGGRIDKDFHKRTEAILKKQGEIEKILKEQEQEK